MSPESKNNKTKKGPGSFWISNTAIDLLIQNKATAEQICTYLILSRHVDNKATSVKGPFHLVKLSTAGIKSLYNYAGLTPSKSEQALKKLTCPENEGGLQLILTPDAYNNIFLPANQRINKHNLKHKRTPSKQEKLYPIVKRSSGNRAVRWILDTFDEKATEGIWFPNEVVDGIKPHTPSFGLQRPLRKIVDLPRYKDEAARFLLLMYRHHAMSTIGGIDPSKAFYLHYDSKEIASLHHFSLCQTTESSLVFADDFLQGVLSEGDLSPDSSSAKRPQAIAAEVLQALIDSKFLYTTVKVMKGHPCDPDLVPRYELATKHHKYGYNPPNPHALASKIALLFREMEIEVGVMLPGGFRFDGQYPFAVQEGHTISVMGIYRPRYELSNPKNYPVEKDRSRREIEHSEALELIETLKSRHFPSPEQVD